MKYRQPRFFGKLSQPLSLPPHPFFRPPEKNTERKNIKTNLFRGAKKREQRTIVDRNSHQFFTTTSPTNFPPAIIHLPLLATRRHPPPTRRSNFLQKIQYPLPDRVKTKRCKTRQKTSTKKNHSRTFTHTRVHTHTHTDIYGDIERNGESKNPTHPGHPRVHVHIYIFLSLSFSLSISVYRYPCV